MDHAKGKNDKNCAQKWYPKLCAFLFEVTWTFGKMCVVTIFLTLFDIFRLCELVLEVLKAVKVSPSNSVPDTFASFLDHF